MKFFLAPMQGLTGYTVRNAFHHHFDYIDKYYTPFIPAAKRMNAKIKRDIAPINNDGITLIPQAMSIVADEVIDLHRQLVPYGYDEKYKSRLSVRHRRIQETRLRHTRIS